MIVRLVRRSLWTVPSFAFLLALLWGGAAPATTPSGARLKTLLSAHGLRAGTVVKNSAIDNDADFRATLNDEFDLITPEFEMKMATVQPTRGTFNFVPGQDLIDYAQAHGLAVHGHTLVWHVVPSWVSSVPLADREAVLKDHVERTVQQYAGDILVWDVVNEAFESNGTYRNSVWYAAMGSSYIAKAFGWARGKDPNARLIYNDYGIETINPKSDAVYAMVSQLKAQGVPIDGVGFQCHLSQAGIDYQSFADNLLRFAELGVELYITELDVTVNSDPPTAADLNAQADVYRSVLDTVLFRPEVKAFQMWGHTDAYSWKASQSPLLFDASYQAKPAYYAVQDRLQNGGFSGYYRLVAKSSGKVMHVDGGSTANGATIVQYADHGWASQRWELKHLGGGLYQIFNKNSLKSIKPVNGSTSAGALMEQYDYSGFASQKWRPVYTGDGYFKLVSAPSGLVIRVQNGALTDGAPLDQWGYTGADNHRWRIESAP